MLDYTLYFHAEFSEPMKRFGIWEIEIPDSVFPVEKGLAGDYFQTDGYYELVSRGTVIEGAAQRESNHLGFFAEFPAPTGRQIAVKAGISYVSVEGARNNLQHDVPGWGFTEVRERGVGLWKAAFGAVEIEGGTLEQKAIFATALYHAMIDPRIVSDADGNYRAADNKTRKATQFTPRTIFSGWDVFRAAFPLMTLLNPTMVNDEVNSLIQLADLSGKGYLERWEIMNSYSGCMDGDPAISVILDAYRKGIRKFDIERAYAACRQTAAGTNERTNRPDNEFYVQHGYVPNQVSWTLDNAYSDWCVATLAASLGQREDAQVFFARAANYKNIYDPGVGCVRAKDANGKWIPWEGRTVFGQGCTESNPGQQVWFVPHDINGLIHVMGKQSFVQQLEELFDKTPPSFNWNDYYNHANEPVHHVPYLFVYAGKPWLTQKWVRRILSSAYHNAVNGICGNDDVGQISAWYILSAMGFYPVCPGDNTYILGSPLFSKITINLDPQWYSGKTFVVRAHGQSAAHPYIQSATLNGNPLGRAWITHDEIVRGGTLDLVMGPRPNEKWGTEDLPPSMSVLAEQKGR